MRIEVDQRIASPHWCEMIQWFETYFDEIIVYDSAGSLVSRHTLAVWGRWAKTTSDAGLRPVSSKVTIVGDDELIIWFKLKFL